MATRIWILSIGILAALALKAAADETSYDYSGFGTITVRDGVEAIIVVGPDHSVEAEALRGDLERLVIEQRGNRLVIYREQNWGFWNPGRRDRFRVTISVPELSAIEATAGARAEVTDAFGDMDADVSSGASLTFENAAFEDLVANSTSGASLVLDGRCEEITAKSSSGASIRAQDLVCETGQLDASSGASLRAFVTQSVAADASSGASIRVSGGADITEQDVSGGASVDIR